MPERASAYRGRPRRKRTPSLCEDIAKYLEEGTSPEEILEKQRQEYIVGIRNFLDNHQTKVNVWNVLKEDRGFKEVKLEDIPLDDLKAMFIALTID